MGRYLWKRFCKLLCLIFIIWLICKKFGINLIDWFGIENVIIATVPSVIIFAAIIYIVISFF